jgi:hypothetical protein
MVVLVFVQFKVAAEGVLVKLDDGTIAPEQTVMLAGTCTIAWDFTVMV